MTVAEDELHVLVGSGPQLAFVRTGSLVPMKVIALLAYCLQVALSQQLRVHAGGLSVLDNLAAVQMIDVHIPKIDACEAMLTCHTEPEHDL